MLPWVLVLGMGRSNKKQVRNDADVIEVQKSQRRWAKPELTVRTVQLSTRRWCFVDDADDDREHHCCELSTIITIHYILSFSLWLFAHRDPQCVVVKDQCSFRILMRHCSFCCCRLPLVWFCPIRCCTFLSVRWLGEQVLWLHTVSGESRLWWCPTLLMACFAHLCVINPYPRSLWLHQSPNANWTGQGQIQEWARCLVTYSFHRPPFALQGCGHSNHGSFPQKWNPVGCQRCHSRLFHGVLWLLSTLGRNRRRMSSGSLSGTQ